MKIYEIDKAIEEILSTEVTEDGEISQQAFEAIEELTLAKEERIDSLLSYYKDSLADSDKIKAEAKALTARARVLENRAASLKSYLACVIGTGRKWQNARHKVAWRKSQAVEVLDAKKVPPDFIIDVEPKINKAALKLALKAGEKVEGARLEERENMIIG